MKIINVEQRSDEWFDIRKGRMTASHAQAIGANGKGLITYINQICVEMYSKADPVSYSNAAMERGIELEDSAAFLYPMEAGLPAEKVGFVIYNDYVGCSPDLLVGTDGMAEIKCPADPEFLRRLMGGEIKSEYIWQVQMQLLICERSWCDFVTFSPNFDKELIIDRIYPDPKKFAKLKEGFEEGERLIREIQAKMDKILGYREVAA